MTNAPWLPGSTLNSNRVGTITLDYIRNYELRYLDCYALYSPSDITSKKFSNESVTNLASLSASSTSGSSGATEVYPLWAILFAQHTIYLPANSEGASYTVIGPGQDSRITSTDIRTAPR
jgi:hypothetical protein